MKISNLLKLFPVLALMFMMNVPTALAGGTNRGDNTDATAGEKATTTREVTDPAHDRRKGTNNRDANTQSGTDKSNKNRNQDMNDTTGTGTTGSGTGTGGTGTDAGTSGTGTGGTGTSSGGY